MLRDRISEVAAPVAALLFAALCMNFSWVHAWHDGDSILLPFISMDRWLPFYWGDNRYGMPVPFLASWIHDPIWNLLFQTQFFALAVIAVLLFGNLFFFHSGNSDWRIRIGSACMALIVAFAVFRPTMRTSRIYFLADPYLISLAPLLLAVALVFRTERWRWATRLLLALPLVFIAIWINYSHVLLAGLLAFFLGHRSLRWRDTLVLRGAFVAGCGACYLVVRNWASHYPSLGGASPAPEQLLATAGRLLATTSEYVVYRLVLVLVLLAGAIAGWLWFRAGMARAWDGVVFAGSAAVFAIVVAASDWPAKNAYEPRYWTTPLVLLLLPATAWIGRALFAALDSMLGSRRFALGMASVIVAAGSLKVFGAPNPSWTRGLLIGTTAQTGRDALRLDCTHMVGDYHIAWLTTFHVRATGHRLWAAVPRGEATRDIWEQMPKSDRRYCGPMQDPIAIQRSFVLFNLGLPPWAGSSGTIIRYQEQGAK